MNAEWANEEKIKQKFTENNLGIVKKVRVVKKKSMKKDRGYVHSAHLEVEWFNNENALAMQQKINVPVATESRVMLDDKWYFLLLKGRR